MASSLSKWKSPFCSNMNLESGVELNKKNLALSVFLAEILVLSNLGLSATAVDSVESQSAASWQLSSLDQPNLGGQAIDNLYQYPSSAGQGVKVFIACGTNLHPAINGQVEGVAKKAQVEALGACGSDTDGFNLAGQISQVISRSDVPKKVLLIEGAGDNLTIPLVKTQLGNAESAGIVVIANGLTENNMSSCLNHKSLNVSGYQIREYNASRKYVTFANVFPYSEWRNCVDLLSPDPDSLGYVAGVVANFISKNPAATPPVIRNAILSNSEFEEYDGCSTCEYRTLDQAFLLPERPTQAQAISMDIVNQDGSPIMNETEYALKHASWSKPSQQAGEANWFGCDPERGCQLLVSGEKMAPSQASVGTGERVAVVTRTRVDGVVYTMLSYSDKPSVISNLQGQNRVAHSIYLTDGLVGIWYACQRSYSYLQNKLPSDCRERSSTPSNSTTLRASDLGMYILSRPVGQSMFFSRTSGPVGKSEPEVSIASASEKKVGSYTVVRLSVDPDQNSCPNKLTLNISERRPLTSKKLELKLVDCQASYKVKIRANTRVLASVREGISSEPATAESVILATPSLVATAPKRAFGSYNLTVRTSQVRSVKCTVNEEYFSFYGDLLSSRWFEITLQSGRRSLSRKTQYVGVIKGLVTCPGSRDFGDSAATFKVFSY
jgi:hypothetical protein